MDKIELINLIYPKIEKKFELKNYFNLCVKELF